MAVVGVRAGARGGIEAGVVVAVVGYGLEKPGLLYRRLSRIFRGKRTRIFQKRKQSHIDTVFTTVQDVLIRLAGLAPTPPQSRQLPISLASN